MNPFYDLNKKLASIGQEKQQVTESKAAPKSAVQQTLEQALRSDLKSLMEDATGGMGQSNTLEAKTKSYSAKKAAAGKDIGKPGKNFAKIAKGAGGGEKGAKIAGAVLKKLRANESAGDDLFNEYFQKTQDMIDSGASAEEALSMAHSELEAMGHDEATIEQVMGDIEGSIDRGEVSEATPAKGTDISDKSWLKTAGKKPGPLTNVAKGIKAFVQGKPEPMDEESCSVPYNDKTPAHNGMQFEEEQMTLEAVSRKHFQQVADLLKAIPDEVKRKEMALHHAHIFQQQNPRFDIRRFGQAAGVDLEECAIWEELKGGQHKLDVDGDGKIEAGDLAALRAGKEVDEGFADMDRWLAQRKADQGTGNFDKRKVSTGTVYTRKPETFSDEPGQDADAAAGVKRGRGRPKSTKPVEKRVTKGAWKHKVAEEGEEELDEKAEQGKRKFFDKLAPAAKKVAKVVSTVTKGKKEEPKKDSKKPADKKAKKTESAKPDFLDMDKDGNKKEPMKKAIKDKEKKVDETTTAGCVATAETGGKNTTSGVGKGIYDSINFEKMIQESMQVSVECSMDGAVHEDSVEGGDEVLTIKASGDDVLKLKQALQAMGISGAQPAPVSVGHDDSCGTCGGVPCQCDDQIGQPGEIEIELGETDSDEFTARDVTPKRTGDEWLPGETDSDDFRPDDVIDEADAPVTDNNPDYPSNQEYSDDELQYAGGLNGPKSTGQTTTPVIASQLNRQVSESDSFLNLYKVFSKIVK